MTKKHYIKVAAAFNGSLPDARDTDHASRYFTLRQVAEKLCVVFALDNPNFKRETFLRACGLAE